MSGAKKNIFIDNGNILHDDSADSARAERRVEAQASTISQAIYGQQLYDATKKFISSQGKPRSDTPEPGAPGPDKPKADSADPVTLKCDKKQPTNPCKVRILTFTNLAKNFPFLLFNTNE